MSAAAAPNVTKALLQVLCHGSPAYDVGYVGWGTPGLFSMLNSVADELLWHVYRGERPRDVRAFYDGTRLLGYGRVAISNNFAPWSCMGVPLPDHGDVMAWAVPTLLQESRYVVASRVLHVLYQPRTAIIAAPSTRYAVAVHLRRGDKLAERRNAERIQLWNDSQVVPAVARLVRERAQLGGGAASRPTILLASDDNGFATHVAASLRDQIPGVDVVRPLNEHDAGTKAPFFSCPASCIAPLQQLAAGFARADALMLSSKSNMGSFMLTHWGAANGDAIPTFIDMDAKTTRGQLLRRRHFCGLSWGSRHGMCESNITHESVGPPTAGGAEGEKVSRKPPPGVPGVSVRSGGAVDGCESALSGSDGVADVTTALTRILCEGSSDGYAAVGGLMLRDGVAGLFSQLNVFADGLLTSAYQGRGPRHGLAQLLATTRLVGYGGGALSDFFEPAAACSAAARGLVVTTPKGALSRGRKVCPLGMSEAVDALKANLRYTVVSGLFRVALRPRKPTSGGPRFDLAVHVRRGDRLWVERTVEKISEWAPEKLLEGMLKLLRESTGGGATGGSATGGSATGDARPATPWRVLLASDDNAYLDRLAALGRAAGMHVEVVGNDAERFDAQNRSMEAAKVCGATCVASLLEMTQRFARANALMLSTKSNLGGFLLSYWGAANPTRKLRGLVDLDGALRREALPRRYFCELQWGSRHGLCASGQTMCDNPRNAHTTFCKAGKTSGHAKAGGAGPGKTAGKNKGKGAGASPHKRRKAA